MRKNYKINIFALFSIFIIQIKGPREVSIKTSNNQQISESLKDLYLNMKKKEASGFSIQNFTIKIFDDNVELFSQEISELKFDMNEKKASVTFAEKKENETTAPMGAGTSNNSSTPPNEAVVAASLPTGTPAATTGTPAPTSSTLLDDPYTYPHQRLQLNTTLLLLNKKKCLNLNKLLQKKLSLILKIILQIKQF